jgi:hypothetical protein
MKDQYGKFTLHSIFVKCISKLRGKVGLSISVVPEMETVAVNVRLPVLLRGEKVRGIFRELTMTLPFFLW